jgi:hypothetical protein
MILRLSSPAARSLLALLASMPATALSYSGIGNAFPNKVGWSAWVLYLSLVPQSAESTKQ